MIAEAALAALVSSCAPSIAPDTMTAVVMVESSANPLAIGDNTARRSYTPRDIREAVATATMLLSRGHNIDLGLGQVNSDHLGGTVSVPALFDPCQNLRVASSILAADYTHAFDVFHDQRYALRAALGAYNTGSIYAGQGYASRVVAAAAVPSLSILTAASPLQSLPVHGSPAATPVPTREPIAAPGPWRGTWGHP
jgi:type IV secretion system protein VirB1